MKTQRNILIAFILNLSFAIFELVGGAITGSVAIMSDALHDLGDAMSIGISYFLERKSKKHADDIYTFGYSRYSVIGSIITTLILLFGSVMVIYSAILRIFHPVEIHYDGMIIFAVFGVLMNFAAAWITREGASLNQRAVNLHMLEDVLGWVVVLIGAIIMRFTDVSVIDPIMSIFVAFYILINTLKNLKEVIDLFLEKVPKHICVGEIKEHIEGIEGVIDVHHIHIWSMDGINNLGSMHIVTDENAQSIKEKVRAELREHHIGHVTLEIEDQNSQCEHRDCHMETDTDFGHHHGHHHHHHHGHHHSHTHEH